MRPGRRYYSSDDHKRKDIKLQAEERLPIKKHKLKINEGGEGNKKWGRGQLKDIREVLEEPRDLK
jgi:DNA-binding transcriptional MerR regulator